MKIIITACIFLLLACQGPSSDRTNPVSDTSMIAKPARKLPVPDTTTLGGAWVLQPVLASDTAAGKRPSLHFDLAKTHFYGNTGCNNMNGRFWYSDKDSSMSFSDKIITTRMACPGYNEQSFLKSLLQTNHYRLIRGTLILLSDGDSELSRWERKATVPAKSVKA